MPEPNPEHLLDDTTPAGRRLVFVSLERWDDHWRRNQFFVRELATRGWRVLFVEPAADLSAGLRRRDREQFRRRPPWSPEGLPGVTVVRPFKLVPKTVRYARWVNDRLRWRCVRRAMIRAWGGDAFDPAGVHLWINDQSTVALLEHGPWARTVYDITDDWTQLKDRDAWVRQIVADDATLCRRADVTIGCSPMLFEKLAGRCRARALVRNGVDAAHFAAVDTAAPAVELAGIERPVLGYTGTVHTSRVDVEMVRELADRMTRGTLVFVGPSHLDTADREMLEHPRVRLLGARPYAMLPSFFAGFDAAIVPHRVDAFTDSLDPIKLWEYLAVGRPILATRVAGFREQVELVTLCADADDFATAAAELPVDCCGVEKRRAAAAGHGWDARADVLHRLLAGPLPDDGWPDIDAASIPSPNAFLGR